MAAIPPPPPANVPPQPPDETPFWTDRTQMGLSGVARTRLEREGLEIIVDFQTLKNTNFSRPLRT